MRNGTRRLILSILIGMLVAACGAQQPGETAVSPTATLTTASPTPIPPAYTPTFTATDCRFETTSDYDIDCGTLLVPEDRSKPDGAGVRLHVAIVRATGSTPAPDPIIYLSGGPGSSALSIFDFTLSPFQGMLQERDLILFDQRGVGFSEPALTCPEWADVLYPHLDKELTSDEQIDLTGAAVHACRDRVIAAGINPAAYTSAASAADVADLRHALGFETVNLYGISYGTRLALTILRDYPTGIRSVVLDSAVPPQVNFYDESAANAQRAFDLLWARCKADNLCNTTYPDLENRFFALVEKLDAEPVTTRLRNPNTGEYYDVLMNGDVLIDALFGAMYITSYIAELPRQIAYLERGATGFWNDAIAQIAFSSEGMADGMRYSINCYEEAPFNQLQVLPPAGEEVDARLLANFADDAPQILRLCDIWDVPEPPALETEAVRSDVPTLVLAGDHDPITPPAWGQLAAETLSHSYYYEFPGVGHGVLSSRRCAVEITQNFYDTPEESPEAECFAKLRDPGFLR